MKTFADVSELGVERRFVCLFLARAQLLLVLARLLVASRPLFEIVLATAAPVLAPACVSVVGTAPAMPTPGAGLVFAITRGAAAAGSEWAVLLASAFSAAVCSPFELMAWCFRGEWACDPGHQRRPCTGDQPSMQHSTPIIRRYGCIHWDYLRPVIARLTGLFLSQMDAASNVLQKKLLALALVELLPNPSV